MTAGSHTDLSPACPSLQNCIRGLVALLLIMGLGACQSSDNAGGDDGAPPVVDVTAVDYAFHSPDSIPSGWTTFRMTNKGEEMHHFHLYGLPEGKRLGDYRKDYVTPLDSLLQLLAAGRIDSAEARAAYEQDVAKWARSTNLAKRGGMGGVAPGRTGQATFRVDPGTYVMDCEARNSEGRQHRALGMIREIRVKKSSSNASPPRADVTIRVSGNELLFDGPVTAGTRTFGFEVDSMPAGADSAYFASPGRLGPDTGVDDLRQWADQGYPYPVPTEYLGGFEYIESDRTIYTTLNLTAGRYAWHWGWFGEGHPDLFEEFTVEDRE